MRSRSRTFGLPCCIIEEPETGTPLMVPAARKRLAPADDAVAGTA
ncbi:MAG TPA: hypothetical protein VFH94_01485 [Streptomyces sp.]|nr:hypothetical protein [Streptomyces sp.]